MKSFICLSFILFNYRFSVNDENKHLCNGNSSEYLTPEAVQYRKWVAGKLVEWTNNIIASLQENIDCFPSSLAWLVGKIADVLGEIYGANSKEVKTHIISIYLRHLF